MEKGNVLIIATIFIAVCIVIILFIATVFMSHVNSILYNIKLEMYSMNKSAIIAVNKTKTSIDDFSYSTKTFREYFEKALKDGFELDDHFENTNKLIESIKIVEYKIIESGKRDTFTHERCDDRVIHTVIEAKIKPIIMRQFFEKIFTFTIHEDINLNLSNEI